MSGKEQITTTTKVIGRPLKPSEEKLDFSHPFKMAAEQKKEFNDFAKSIYQSLSGFLRQAAHYFIANPPKDPHQEESEEVKKRGGAKLVAAHTLLLTDDEKELFTRSAEKLNWRLNKFLRVAACYYIKKHKG